jgi:serine/threonine protein kinase
MNAQNVQHRDIKPANLLLLNGGVKIADFGLAKVLEETIASNSGAGTLAYTAPECFKGQLTQQSDQYSLAMTYYHLRTGRQLFQGNQAQVTYAHLDAVPDFSLLSSEEGVVLARALLKAPEKRWDSCAAFVYQLIARQKEMASQKAEKYQRDEARRRQRVENRRSAQESHNTEDDTEKRPRQEFATAVPEDVGPPERRGVQKCWWCQDRAADASPEVVKLYIVEEKLTDMPAMHRRTTVLIPQCSECIRFGANPGFGSRAVLLFSIIAFFGSFLLLVLSVSFKMRTSIQWVALIALIISTVCLMIGGLVVQSRQATFPQVKALLDAGWKFGDPLDT